MIGSGTTPGSPSRDVLTTFDSSKFSRSELVRILMSTAATDTKDLPKVPQAGQLINLNGQRVQVMHNGLVVVADGYYGPFVTELIGQTQGHHEPQEEKIFALVLQSLRPNPVILELGSYWCYYSMWLLKERPGGHAICVEPIEHRRAVGARNLAINRIDAELVKAAIAADDFGETEFKTGAEVTRVPMRSIDSLLAEREIGDLDILHMDIQGFEYRALLGAKELLAAKRAAWIFISTHRNLEDGLTSDLHARCLETLTGFDYQVVAAHTPEESFSVDGLIVAKAPGTPGPDKIQIQHSSQDILDWAQREADRRMGK